MAHFDRIEASLRQMTCFNSTTLCTVFMPMHFYEIIHRIVSSGYHSISFDNYILHKHSNETGYQAILQLCNLTSKQTSYFKLYNNYL